MVLAVRVVRCWRVLAVLAVLGGAIASGLLYSRSPHSVATRNAKRPSAQWRTRVTKHSEIALPAGSARS